MLRVFGVVIVAEESLIEAELQDYGDERECYGQERQDAEFFGREVARIHGHQHKPERAVDHAPYSEYERVLDGLFYLAVNRNGYP